MSKEIDENKENKLSGKQEQAIQLLACGTSITEAAKRVEVDRVTIYRWLQDKHFSKELNKMSETYTYALFFQAVFELEGILQTGRDVDKLKAIELIMSLNGKNLSKNGNNVNFVKVETPTVTLDDLLSELENM